MRSGLRSTLLLALLSVPVSAGATPVNNFAFQCKELFVPETLDPGMHMTNMEANRLNRFPGMLKDFLVQKPKFISTFSREEKNYAYSKLVEYALQNGTNQADLKIMIDAKDFFAIPRRNRKLKALDIHFRYLKARFGKEIATEDAESILRKYIAMEPEKIVNGYVPTSMRKVTEGLAPRDQFPGTSEIILYLIPSPKGLDWDSPAGLMMSTLKNRMSSESHRIGHVNVEIRQNNETLLFSGMTGAAQQGEASAAMKAGNGLGTMFDAYSGWLEGYRELIPQYQEMSLTGRVSYLRIKVNNDALGNMLAHFKQFTQNGGFEKYSLSANPLKAEGAGCSSFSMSFLAAAGLVKPEFKARWSRTISVPERLIGNTLHNGPVSMPKLALDAIFGKSLDNWAKPGELARKVFFWDPDLMDSWIRRTFADNYQKAGAEVKTETYNFTNGVALDMSNVVPPKLLPTTWE